MVHLTLSPEAGLELILGGSDHEACRYRIRRVRRGAWALELSRPGHCYTASVDGSGGWECDCPAWRFCRPGAGGRKACKHVRAARELRTLCEELAMSEKQDIDDIARRLSEPFDASEVKFKPQTVSGNRALALPYVDARVIQDRLDEVLGVMGWQDSYEFLPDGAVVCKLSVRIGDAWVVKMDVGGESEQPDGGDRRKAAVSDALKRAAVKFGLGRYLYRQKPQWVDYDPQKRQFVTQPRLPASAQPAPLPPAAKAEAPAAPAAITHAQHLEILRLLKESGVDPAALCRWLQVEDTVDILAADYERAVRRLNVTIEKRKGEPAPAA